ncbi:MAG: AI-2E family transporter [Thermodesulfobacteriota bacterium]|nr:AI-2E family transporter [Thermodesulfobacteriota bacterium]
MKYYLKEWRDRVFSDPQVLNLALVLCLGALVIFFLGGMLLPFFIALIVSFLLDGIVLWLERFKVPRRAGVMIVFILFVFSIVLMIVGLVPLLTRQVGELVHTAPAMISSAQQGLEGLPDKYPEHISRDQIDRIFEFFSMEFTALGKKVFSFSIASLKGIITLMVYLILVPLMVFFFLRDKGKILEWVSGFFPKERGLATEIWQEVNEQITNYIRGKGYEILIVWAASYLLFLFLGLDFGILLSVFVGLSVLIPYIGAISMFFPVALIAFFQWGMDMQCVYTMIAYIILQMFDGNLLVPLLLSGVVNLHPVAVIVAILVFGGLWGFWGLLFAIPLATLVQALLRAWAKRSKDLSSYKDAKDAKENKED